MADHPHKLGWVGTGRMGTELVRRLLSNGADVWVYNRTRSKAEPLAEAGATIVDSPAELAGRDIVFSMVAGPKDVMEVHLGEQGTLSRPDQRPSVIVDSTTIDLAVARSLRDAAAERGVAVLAAPVSGNPKVVASGKLTVAASGPVDAYEQVRPYLEMYGRRVTYVGAEDEARLVKICHNLFLGVVTQSLAETAVLAEKAGVSRSAYLEFMNDSVMGSTFSRYKTPAFVNLDWKPTFTWHLLRKDFELGLQEARERDVLLPAAALVHQLVVEGIGRGIGDQDFGSLLEMAAAGSGMTLEAEDVEVSDGLS